MPPYLSTIPFRPFSCRWKCVEERKRKFPWVGASTPKERYKTLTSNLLPFLDFFKCYADAAFDVCVSIPFLGFELRRSDNGDSDELQSVAKKKNKYNYFK